MSQLELEEHIEQELEKNPVLEMAEPERSADEDASQSEIFEKEHEIVIGESENSQEDFLLADEFANLYRDTIDESPSRSQNWLESEQDRRDDFLANVPSESRTLYQFLTEQLYWIDLTKELRQMVERILSNLDKNGYFSQSEDQFLGSKTNDEERKLFSEGLAIVRDLEPTGVGALDLKDCLMMQLTDEHASFEILYELISKHLEDVMHNRLPYISKQTGFSIEAIQNAIEDLRQLRPRPSAGFADAPLPSIIPDVIIDRNDDGTYSVRIEDERIPKVQISGYYRDLMQKQDADKVTKDYIKQKIGSAQWLIDLIQQRKNTLLRVAGAIVEHQTAFLEYGPLSIKPLKMQQIADKVGVHVTTVSRACDDKYMQTPQGIFPFKRFFTGSISSSESDDEQISQDAVMSKLREIVDSEDKTEPYADEDLVKMLVSNGIKIARRTIAKYRLILKIPSSRERRIWN